MSSSRLIAGCLFALAASSIFPVAAAAQSDPLPQNKGFITIAKILGDSCANCHEWATSYRGIADPARIVATQPEKSILYQQILTDKMPLSGPNLSMEKKNLIKAWLGAGAPSSDAPLVSGPRLPQPCPCGLE